MLEARSVAVVGASVKTGSLGRQMMAELRRGGFDGAVYPVNPAYDEVDGYRCYPSLLEIPEPVDLAILGVANARIEAAMADAAELGAGSVVTFSSLYEEPSDGPSLAERVAAIAAAHGIAVCGGNGMGFVNVPGRLRATGFATPDDLRPGPVTFLSHSGSAFAALAFNDRGIGFDLLVSSGREVVTPMDAYLRFALERQSTQVVALLLETVRNPDGFRAGLERAAERDVPVLALAVGRTDASKTLVTAHSGALAGEHGAYEAVFDAYGVQEVRSLDEMVDAIELFSAPRRVHSGRGIASIHDSGGERALFVDLATELDVPIANVSDATLGRIGDTLDPGLEAANPLDAWGTGIDADRIFRESFAAFHDDDDVAAMAFVVDLTRQGEPYDEGYLQVARDVWASTTKPFCVLSNLSAAVASDEVRMIRDDGIPVLEGTTSGLRALKHLLDDATWRARPAATRPPRVPQDMRSSWRARLAAATPVEEREGLRLLADYGVPTVTSRSAESASAAVEAAEALGYPVALKTAAPGVLHKTDSNGVRLGIDGAPELSLAYADLAARLGPEVTVSAMAPPGVEVALGIVRDATFGPLVLVAAGGVLVEVLHDRALGLPPLDDAAALRLIDRLKIRPILDGVRGAKPSDVAALAHAVSRMSVLAEDLGD
ncbi:MAG: acetate--CoA ligase family protein, partial [Actinomycetota bacterium]|nr:acetate--CoA ligase family protein [Actinomycetota bacterium]